MAGRKRFRGVQKLAGVLFLAMSLAVTQIPAPEVNANSSQDDFRMDGSTLMQYLGTAEAVSIPAAVKAIGAEAFADNKTITSVTIPEGVTKIEFGAFTSCSKLQTVIIPDSVTQVGASAFSDCQALVNVSMGKGVSAMGSGLFAGCSQLKTVTISSVNENFVCQDGVIYNKAKTKLYEMLPGREGEDYTMPSSVTDIMPYAFWGCHNLKTVTVSDKEDEIPAYAFSNCNSLERVILPSSLNAIQMKAFENCVKLSDITIHPSAIVDSTAFDGCYLLNEGTASSDATGSQDEAGQQTGTTEGTEQDQASGEVPTKIEVTETENDNLLGKTKIVANNAVVLIDSKNAKVLSGSPIEPAEEKTAGEIPEHQYYRDSSLLTYQIDHGVTAIRDFAFARSGLTAIVIPDGITKIGYAAFYHCDDLAEVSIPDTVTEIGANAFGKTKWLQNFLNGTGDEEFCIVGDGILLAYRGTGSTVVIPDGVKQIASGAFANHEEITDIVLPDSAIKIADDAFTGCSNLQNISGGQYVEEVEDYAFAGTPLTTTTESVEMRTVNSRGYIGKYQVLERDSVKESSVSAAYSYKWLIAAGCFLTACVLFTYKRKGRSVKRNSKAPGDVAKA